MTKWGKVLQELYELLLSTQGNVQFNSQKVKSGDIFFALKGERTDGHRFLKEVAAQGACFAVVDRCYEGEEFLPCRRVDSVLDTLQNLASLHIQKIKPKIIALTGDMGKTSTKEFLYTFLEDQHVAKNQGSFNTKISLPSTILNELQKQKILLLEMGMTRKSEIKKLVSIAPPDLAAITSLPSEKRDYIHAGYVDSYDEIIQGKIEIFSNEKTKGFFPYSFRQYIQNKKVQTFSIEEASADFFGKISEGKLLIFEKGKKVASLRLHIPHHHFSNALVAAVLAKAQGLSWQKIEEKSEKLKLIPNRFEIKKLQNVTYINDAYNASPIAYAKAFEQLRKMSGRKIGVLGHMGDLGVDMRNGHQRVLELAKETFDICFLVGQNWKQLGEIPFTIYDEKKELLSHLQTLITSGDVVFFKGSRVLEMETFYEKLT